MARTRRGRPRKVVVVEPVAPVAPPQQREYFDRREAAEYLGIGLTMLAELMRRSRNPIPFRVVGARYVFARAEIDKWFAREPRSQPLAPKAK